LKLKSKVLTQTKPERTMTMKKPSSKIRLQKTRQYLNGFTLTEAMVTVGIVGILSTISLPHFFTQKSRSCQAQPENAINQAMTQAQAYAEEFGTPANNWGDLNKIATLNTTNGPASGSNFNWIELPSCGYKLTAQREGNAYTFIAAQTIAMANNQPGGQGIDSSKNKFNVVGCVNTATGASDLARGNGITPANTESLNCG
jgi:type IV pilus assembly protein PilA